ncbi:MAG: cyclic nucleotide-binding domain-containing protein [Natronospirillum sp.]|uniref:Crp/Fnr family transcriptional regulator n=1 Tax=Natronospirillum sp. TaxID=2812955 RepID=UPI0025FA14A5|nr:cyclic nucleotide-binding domain-containing protein [Natronospirillum sp.]MCH8550902.1 cyclic nucleotide-binding domain-containing protein [Natronospirillum sp.]
MQVVDHLSREKQLEILAKADFFSRFSDDEKKILLMHGPELLAFKEGEWIIMEGDDKDSSLYVVLNGLLSVWSEGEKVADIGRGHCFGEVSFLRPIPRTGSVRCESRAAIFRLKREHMNRLPVTAREKIKDNLIAILLNRVTQGVQTGEPASAPDGKDLWETKS